MRSRPLSRAVPAAAWHGRAARPVPGGSLEELLPFLNLDRDDEASFHLACGWLVQALRPTGPYLGYAAYGEQGTAKSTRTRILRALIDPSTSSLRALPQGERDLMISAANNWVVSFDNVSFITDWISDALCRLATGGGLATRQLYTDAEEVIFDECRPEVLNSIEEVITRPDMLDRFITDECQRIPDEQRRTEAEFWAAFEEVRRPQSTARCSTLSRARCATSIRPVSSVFRAWPTPRGGSLPPSRRSAGSPAPSSRRSWTTGVPPMTSCSSRHSSHSASSAMADPGYLGTATDLLAELNADLTPDQLRAKAWPKNGNSLVGKLKRLAPALRRSGVDVETGIREPGGRRRLVVIQRITPPEDPVTGVTPVTDAGVLRPPPETRRARQPR